jgi:hypothetical protein
MCRYLDAVFEELEEQTHRGSKFNANAAAHVAPWMDRLT